MPVSRHAVKGRAWVLAFRTQARWSLAHKLGKDAKAHDDQPAMSARWKFYGRFSPHARVEDARQLALDKLGAFVAQERQARARAMQLVEVNRLCQQRLLKV